MGANGAVGSSHLECAHNLLGESLGLLTAPNWDSSPGAEKMSTGPRALPPGLEWRSWLFWGRGVSVGASGLGSQLGLTSRETSASQGMRAALRGASPRGARSGAQNLRDP